MKWTIVSILLLGLMFPMISSALTDSEKVGGGPITFTPKNARPVVFSHEKHVSEKGLKCSGCHFQIFQMAQGSYKMDMSKITKGDFCGKCHNGQKSFDVNDKKNCIRCHK
jgi:c(7)-type cytochrome triheme protein